ncbi:MAG: hypothetical protein JKY54_18090 [Flavobacteriales bacterium]|nr:hypothetical protein [Flavobacteriales bacterium]
MTRTQSVNRLVPMAIGIRNSGLLRIWIPLCFLILISSCTSTTEEPEILIEQTSVNSIDELSEFGRAVTRGQKVTLANLTNRRPLIPADIYRNLNHPAIPPSHEDLATFAWLEFISLVAKEGNERGLPGGSFLQSGSNPNQILNWQTYHHRVELFPYRPKGQAKAPTPWNSTPKYDMSYKDARDSVQPYPVPYNEYTNLDEASQIAQNLLFFPSNPNTMNPVNDHQALYEAKVNKISWNYVNNNYTTLNNITPSIYPDGITLPDSTVHLKATWKPLASIPENERYKYHISTGIYYEGSDSNPVARTKQFALIGLHVIHKTPNYPAFIYATFEHMDNLKGKTYYVPTYEAIQYALPDSVPTYNGDSLHSPNPFPSDYVNNPYAEPNGNRINLVNYNVRNARGAQVIPIGGGQTVIGVPVSSPPTTNRMVGNVNAHVLRLMKSLPGFDKNFVWQYYFLKGVQGVPTNNESAPDFYLTNNVTESSIPGLELFRGGQSISFDLPQKPLQIRRNELNVMDLKQGGDYQFCMGGCQGCHGISKRLNGFDFSFLYFGAASGYSPDVIGLKQREELNKLLKKYDLSKRRSD